MSEFIVEYVVFVAVASVGAIQIAASFGQLKGLLFLQSDRLTRVAATLLILGITAWFFGSGDRNINDLDGGIDANGQALYFSLGAVIAVVVTCTASSLINARMQETDISRHEGLEALKHTNYLSALRRSLRCWSRK